MFGKKLLSLVSLLFLGSKFATVSADCTTTYSGGLLINEECDIGYYLINKAGNGLLASVASNECVGETCTLVYCSENDNSTTCTPKASVTGLVTYGLDGTTILECTAGQCSVKTASESGCTGALAGGIISGGSKLCITAENSSEKDFSYSVTNNSYYYITVAIGSTTVFTGPDEVSGNAKKVLVRIGNGIAELITAFGDRTTNYLAHDGSDEIAIKYDGVDTISKNVLITGDEEYCVDDNTKVITERSPNFCTNGLANVNCDKYYLCDSGVCQDKTTTIDARQEVTCNNNGINGITTCDDGDYYITVTGQVTLKDGTGAGDLVECKATADPSIIQCNKKTDIIGYLKNADGTNASTIPYIKCSAKNDGTATCEAIGQPSESACTDSTAGTGKLIYNSVYKICIDGTHSVDIENASVAGSYLIDASKDSAFEHAGVKNIYSVVAKIGGGNAIRKPQDGKKYIYVKTTTKQVFEKGETGASDLCSGDNINSGAATEYVLNKKQGTDYVDYYKVKEA